MDIMLSHFTALEAIRRQETRWILEKDRPARIRIMGNVPADAPTDSEVSALLARSSLLAGLSQPLETLVPRGAGRRRSRLVKTHVCAQPIPASSFLELAPGVLCVSPEHLAVQLAPLLSELELIVLLSELLGAYAIVPGVEDGMFQRRRPVTTRELIANHLDALGSFAGVAKVRRALRLACVGSGSPRETKLSLRLGLNPARGGYGLDVLSMNEPLEVHRIHNMMKKGVRKPDILLRAPAGATRNGRALLGAAVEYDGKDHATEEAHQRDAARHNELTAIGVVEYLVTKAQYRDLAYMDGLVAQIRRDLGTPAKRRTRAKARQLRELRQKLYVELELIDGVNWNGLERARRRAEKDEEAPNNEDWEVVPTEAYGLD